MSMTAVVYVNGRISDSREASVPIFDHGFLYGEGIYETLRTYAGVPFLFDRHMQRLRQSAARMALDVPFADHDLLARIGETMAALAVTGERYVRVIVTRGVGDLSYDPAACPVPTLVIIVKPYVPPAPRTFADGIRVSLVGVRRNHPRALDPMIKSNNLLNNALAMQEAYRRGAEEALMQNQAGEIVECSQSNIFLIREGVALTPPLSAGLLPGITRAFVMELAAESGVPCHEAHLTPADLETTDEAFLTGTTREVTPVIAVDDRPIGRGVPGAVTRRLQAQFTARVAALIGGRAERPEPTTR